MVKDSLATELSIQDSIYLASKRALTERRRNGVFYTPEPLTAILSRWAIRSRDETVLEPSFGGCGFLVSVRNRLVELENHYPQGNLFGCDIDDDAFGILRRLFDNNALEDTFLKRDFLTVTSGELPQVDVVIGNPPYISWHKMSLEQRHSASALTSKYGLANTASLWMHFILHSLSFIKPSGRMAWILPGSFIFSDYSVQFRNILSKFFEKIFAIYLEERIFIETGTEESSVVLLCDGFNVDSKTQIEFRSAKDLDSLSAAIDAWTNGLPQGQSLVSRPKSMMIPPQLYQTFTKILSGGPSYKIGDIATIKIGLVTGANRFFVLNQNSVDENELPAKFIKPILAKYTQINGLDLTSEDLESSRLSQQRCLLLSCPLKKDLPKSLKAYFDTFPLDEKQKNYTFKKGRSVWYNIDDGDRPDAFFSAMQSKGPCMVLNSAATTCTNTIYKVHFKSDISLERKKAIAVTIQSSFTQFSAELEGRSHGSGALKLEPSEVKRIAILIPDHLGDIVNVFDQVNKCLRDGDRLAAQSIADQFLVDQNIVTRDELTAMQEAVKILRSIRNGHRKE